MNNTVKHDVIKEFCKSFDITIKDIINGSNKLNLIKPFTIIYIANDNEQQFLKQFYLNSGFTGLYQLINYKKIYDYNKFIAMILCGRDFFKLEVV